MDKTYWTASLVEERMEEAASVLKRMPPVKVEGYFGVWPTIVPEFSDLVGREPRPMKRPCPSPSEISRMEEALWWTVELDPTDAKIAWMKAYGKRWREICAKVGLPKTTAARHWFYALCVIAWQLNGKPVPRSRSCRQVITMMRGDTGNVLKQCDPTRESEFV